MDNRLPKLNSYKEELSELKLNHHYQNSSVTEYLGYAIKQISNLIKEGKSIDKIEIRLIENFEELEDIGWYLKDSLTILKAWYQLGKIAGVANIEEKLNQFKKINLKKDKINKLVYLKANIKINNEMSSAPNFYKEMRKLMAESVENVITQLKKNNNIDEMLLVFEIALNKFEILKTDDYSFGDTVDRETIGDFFTEIREILEFNYTRGLLSDKLE
jgi:hypothetical protein